MLSKYKYDVAISVAEEDIEVAEKIAASLKARKITYYLYNEQSAESWGQHILKISLAKYGAEAKYVLVIISKAFIKKHWTSIENQIIQVFKPGKEIYILPLRLDDTPVDGISKYIAFVKWERNEEDIAEKIKSKLQKRTKKARRSQLLTAAIVLLMAGILYYLLLLTQKPAPDYSQYLAYVSKGDSLVKENKFDEAKKEYQQALRYNPADAAASRKLSLLDSATNYVRQNKMREAKSLFEIALSIPPSSELSASALSAAGVTSNPPIKITIRWNGNLLEINISGGIPFVDEKQPYKLIGLNCENCIEWKKEGSNYTAQITNNSAAGGEVTLKDRLGQFATEAVPVNPLIKSAPGVENGSTRVDASAKPPELAPGLTKEDALKGYIAAGDSLFGKNSFSEAKYEYQQARQLKPTDAGIAKKILVCDAKIAEKQTAQAKNIAKVSVAGGAFSMGTIVGNPDDGPAHTVNLNSFAMGKTEVTVAQYRTYCGLTGISMPPVPPFGWSDENPVSNVSWAEAAAYCAWVGGRLPTEAEWEYAANAAGSTLYSGSNQADAVAWHSGNSGGHPGRAGRKSPNRFGLYDMSGNVAEWCADWYGRKYYAQSSSNNPVGPAAGSEKAVRGGAYNSFINSTQDGNQLRITYRNSELPAARKPYIGFRVVWNNQ